MNAEAPLADRRIGFIGTGVMGRPMAANLLAAGAQLVVHNRSAAKARTLIEAGAHWAESPGEAARDADLIITMLPDSEDVAAAAVESDGIFEHAQAGATWIDMSSISPTVTRRLAAMSETKGIECLDAPVSGGEQGAIDATLSIMVGGKAEVLAACLPVLTCLGRSVVHVGEVGAGQVAKACNQLVVGATIAAVAEALTLGERAGVDPAPIRDALLGGLAQSRILDVHGCRMLDHEHRPGFRMRLHQKDLAISLELARTVSAMTPVAAVVAQLMNAVVAGDGADLDHSALIAAYRMRAEL